jgi:hypothetical protein
MSTHHASMALFASAIASGRVGALKRRCSNFRNSCFQRASVASKRWPGLGQGCTSGVMVRKVKAGVDGDAKQKYLGRPG